MKMSLNNNKKLKLCLAAMKYIEHRDFGKHGEETLSKELKQNVTYLLVDVFGEEHSFDERLYQYFGEWGLYFIENPSTRKHNSIQCQSLTNEQNNHFETLFINTYRNVVFKQCYVLKTFGYGHTPLWGHNCCEEYFVTLDTDKRKYCSSCSHDGNGIHNGNNRRSECEKRIKNPPQNIYKEHRSFINQLYQDGYTVKEATETVLKDFPDKHNLIDYRGQVLRLVNEVYGLEQRRNIYGRKSVSSYMDDDKENYIIANALISAGETELTIKKIMKESCQHFLGSIPNNEHKAYIKKLYRTITKATSDYKSQKK